MSNFKPIKLLLVSMSLMAAASGTVRADCTLNGYGIRVATFTGKTLLFFRPFHLANYYYVGFTRDPFISDAMYQGYKGKAMLFVRSNASSCPTITTPGEYNIGEITIVGLGY